MINITEIKDQYLYLYANCIPVKGFSRTMIVDLGRRKLYFIDNSYYELLHELEHYTIGETMEMLEDEDDLEQFTLFLDYLVTNDLANIVDDLSVFPSLNLEWHHPSVISNAIIDVGEKQHDFKKILEELDDLNCKYLQIRSYRVLPVERILEILSYTKGKHFRGVQLLTRYDAQQTSERNVRKILKKFPTLALTIHGSPGNKLIKNNPIEDLEGFELGFILFIKQEISSCSSCGIINSKSFHAPTLEGFAENVNFNGCLNRKIAIDEQGEIRNCPSMTKSYGNIDEVKLETVAGNEKFKALWSLNKDKIDVCRDCEYRYICTDCRAYIREPGNIHSKPAKCSYDPYTATWAD
jgi:SPASM domain peptide maturase of grasp-with-spasm system